MTNKTKPIFNSFQEYMEAEDMIFKTFMKELENIGKIFNSFQEYIEAEAMVFETLGDRVTIGSKDKE